jgi:hypothetical protein
MQEHAQVVLFTHNPKMAAGLKYRFAAKPNIVIFLGNASEVTDMFKLDALCLSSTQASYYGISQPPSDEASRVYPMPREAYLKGLPRLMIAGVPMLPGKVYTERFIGRNPAISLANAIADYNKRSSRRILRAGSIPENLGIDTPDNDDATDALERAFSGLRVYPAEEPGKRIVAGHRAVLA